MGSKSLVDRIAHIMQAAFSGTRLVLFSGGAFKSLNSLYEEVIAIKGGGGTGSIIGRNIFQRPKNEALDALSQILDLYVG